MRIRRLQRRDEHNQWYDDVYTYENDGGQATFCYNPTWEQVGARYKALREHFVIGGKVAIGFSSENGRRRNLDLEKGS